MKSESIAELSIAQLAQVTGGDQGYTRPGSIFEQDGKGGVSWSDQNWRRRPGGDVQPRPGKIYNDSKGRPHALV